MNKRSLMRLTFSAAAAMATMLPLGALAQADYPTLLDQLLDTAKTKPPPRS